MNYRSAIKYVESLSRFGIHLRLKNIKSLLNSLGNPHKDLRVIHIAGTNGKGSTSVMINSILIKSGFKVGLFTSPPLSDFSERIAINNKQISKKQIMRLVEKMKPIVEKMKDNNKIPITQFEFITAMAFLYFKENKVDFCVLEVGLGGRLDATNVVKSMVSVITNITLDHTNILGKNIKSITKEKAGIIKKNGILVTGVNDKISLNVLKKICKEKKSKIYCIGKDITYKKKYSNIYGNKFDVKGIYGNYKNLKISLLGEHQIINSCNAIGAVEALRNYGIAIPENSIKKGLKSAKWPGRLEIIQKNPLVLLDGAHNPDGIDTLCKTLKNLSRKKVILVIGISKTKDIPKMVSKIAPMSNLIIITKSKSEMAVDSEIIKNEAVKYTNDVIMVPEVITAIKRALKIADKRDTVCITGSLFVVGEARQLWHKKVEW